LAWLCALADACGTPSVLHARRHHRPSRFPTPPPPPLSTSTFSWFRAARDHAAPRWGTLDWSWAPLCTRQRPSFSVGAGTLEETVTRLCVVPRWYAPALHPIFFLCMIKLGDKRVRGLRAGLSPLSLQAWQFGGRKRTVGCWLVGLVEKGRAECEFVDARTQRSLPFPSMRTLRIVLQVGSITLELSGPATLLRGSLVDRRKRRASLILVILICRKAGIDNFCMGSYDPIPVII